MQALGSRIYIVGAGFFMPSFMPSPCSAGLPGWFIAFFYTGLGIALTGAGIGFLLELARMLREGRSLHRGA